METVMPRILSALCLVVMTTSAVRMFSASLPIPRRNSRRDRIPLGSDGRSHDPGKRVRPLGRGHSLPIDTHGGRPRMCARIAEVFLHASAGELQSLQARGHSHSGWGRHETLEQSTTDKAKVSLRSRLPTSRQGGHPLHAPTRTWKRPWSGTGGRLPNGASCFISFSTSHSTLAADRLMPAR